MEEQCSLFHNNVNVTDDTNVKFNSFYLYYEEQRTRVKIFYGPQTGTTSITVQMDKNIQTM